MKATVNNVGMGIVVCVVALLLIAVDTAPMEPDEEQSENALVRPDHELDLPSPWDGINTAALRKLFMELDAEDRMGRATRSWPQTEPRGWAIRNVDGRLARPWRTDKRQQHFEPAAHPTLHELTAQGFFYQTGGGLPEYIPPDEILDRVTSLLGNTATGLRVQFGGDREEDEERVQSPNCLGDDCIIEELPGPIQRIKEPIPNKGSPRKRQLEKKLKIGRVELIKERDQAITDYYKRKKDLLDGKIENINLQNEKLKLENEKIKLENEKLKLELEKVK